MKAQLMKGNILFTILFLLMIPFVPVVLFIEDLKEGDDVPSR